MVRPILFVLLIPLYFAVIAIHDKHPARIIRLKRTIEY